MTALAIQTYIDELPTTTSWLGKNSLFGTRRVDATRLFSGSFSKRPATSDYEQLLILAGQALWLTLEKSKIAEPTISWTSDLEPSFSTRYFGLNHFSLNEEHTELSDQDMPLPAYCSRAALAFEHYESLEQGWDGEEAEKPDAATLTDAGYFLRILGSHISELAEARPMLDADGIPGIFWNTDNRYLSISFYGDFSLTYFHKDLQSEYSEARTISMYSSEEISSLLSTIEEFQG